MSVLPSYWAGSVRTGQVRAGHVQAGSVRVGSRDNFCLRGPFPYGDKIP
jgi:hypothetical protein